MMLVLLLVLLLVLTLSRSLCHRLSDVPPSKHQAEKEENKRFAELTAVDSARKAAEIKKVRDENKARIAAEDATKLAAKKVKKDLCCEFLQ